ncbi:hypothetical protein SAMN05661091_3543 [Paenibacillus uliginis N3/975]|uniref:Uncharacterized protein n=1 Tax=Paenibacillus uliginis N3/975 TaxID=1313296 RepID=A0A1X7HHQ8_9BACL|nr:hypothetical protein [Paenibacillus uliginis]SMF86882.1 hypothetical protein SAMN05661091_3543 [Paenibacillus uliginis N3/975]
MSKQLVWLIQILALLRGLAFPFVQVILRIVMLLIVYFIDVVVSEKTEKNRRVLLFWVIGLILGYLVRGEIW